MITQLELRAATRELIVVLDNGAARRLPYATLRAACKCAACEATRRAGGKLGVPAELTVVDLQSVGAHGVNLKFSDGHSRGIYPFDYLEQLALDHTAAPAS